MKQQGSSVAVATLVAIVISFTACNRVPGIKSAPAVSDAAAQRPQPYAAVHTTQATPGSYVLPTAASASDGAARSSTPPLKVVASDRTQGLTVAQHAFRLLTHIQSIEATAEETVEWWELHDANEHVVHRESYPVAFQNGLFMNTVAISASSFTTKRGSGILIHGTELPSAPDSGGWVQVFGFKYGRDKYASDQRLFGSFGPPILIVGEFLNLDTDSLRPTPVSFGGSTAMVERDVLKFRVWTGNINIVYPVLINWISGTLQPAWRCMETTSKGQVERCSYPITVDAHREDQATFVRLFPEADEGFTPKHVIVQPQSKIEYLEARTPMVWNEDLKAISFSVNGDVWIKVRIDGLEGWIHSQEDFEAVGLPQAG